MRTCVTGVAGILKRWRVSGCRAVRGSSSTVPPSALRPVSAAQPGALCRNQLVSSSATTSSASATSATSTQSLPSSRRRAFSQPSPMVRAGPGSSRLLGDP
jgi:hypothetical protein